MSSWTLILIALYTNNLSITTTKMATEQHCVQAGEVASKMLPYGAVKYVCVKDGGR